MIAADGLALHVAQLDQGEPIPDLASFDALWVLGGPMQVWEEEAHPCLVAEKSAIREAVSERCMPYFGLCLGHQLLAEALGGEVGPCAEPEVGVLAVDLTDDGAASPFLAGLARSILCIQGHGAEVRTPPAAAAVLATSPGCAVQAMQIGGAALSLQFHTELTVDMIEACLDLPEYKADVEAMLGPDGVREFIDRSVASEAAVGKDAALIYRNWMRTAFAANPAINAGAT
jgi:GMP synthase-like glutamine amidotransferase